MTPSSFNMTSPEFFFPFLSEKPAFYISFMFYLRYHFYVNVIVSPLICVLGLSGNVVGMRIVWEDLNKRNCSTYLYMFALMVFDSTLLFTGLVIGIISIIEQYDWFLANIIFTYFSFIAGYVDFVVFHSASVLLIIMSLERLFALTSPFEVRLSLLSRYPRRIVLIIFILAVFINMPFPFCFEIISIKGYSNKSFVNIRIKSDLATFYEQYSLAETILSCIYPIILLFINIILPIIYCSLANQRKRSLPNGSTSTHLHQYKVTILVLTIAISYVVLSIPKIMLQTLIFIDPDYGLNGVFSFTFYFFTITGDLLARLNAANDFFIYLMVSKRYRKILFYFCCGRCCRHESRKDANIWSLSSHISRYSLRSQSTFSTGTLEHSQTFTWLNP